MRLLAPTETDALEQLSLAAWHATGETPGFVFDIAAARGRFLGFFLRAASGGEAPRVVLDEGAGFDARPALSFKSFPFAFYHLPLDRMPAARRLRFEVGAGGDPFRFVAFQTSNAILVALLHYLFNLRYQRIGIVAPGHGAGRRRTLAATRARIGKFFGDVALGQGLRVQEGSETLAALRLALSLQAVDVRARMDAALTGRTRPLLSFVTPTYNTETDRLRDLVGSFERERAAYAELILVDDGSTARATRAFLSSLVGRPGIGVVLNAENRGIATATNAGIAAARGTHVAFIDHDDLFVAGAVAIIADAIERHPDALFFYTDELIVDAALKPIGAFCKPAYDSVLLSGLNYINHFSVFRRDRLEAIGRLREDREGAQDHDLLLRYLEGAAVGSIIHIPFLAYMWRREEATYSHLNLQTSVASARRALEAAYPACRVAPAVDPRFHRLRFPRPDPPPRVSIVIPNRDSPALIDRIVSDCLDRTDYPSIEIVIVDNGTTNADTLVIYAALRHRCPDAVVDIVVEPFNFARMCNRGVRRASGDVLLFLNNDIEVGEPGWLGEMVECLSFEAAGIVGARLLFPDGRVQHNGVIAGLGDAAGHWYDGAAADDPGPMGRFLVRQTLSAVTAACMLVTRACFEAVGGFDEEAFAIAYNDVDFCLRARTAGFRTIWTPFATLTHRESISRGSDATGDNNTRFRAEMARLQDRHHTTTLIDDAYSPFYGRRDSRPHIVVPDALPALRPSRLP